MPGWRLVLVIASSFALVTGILVAVFMAAAHADTCLASWYGHGLRTASGEKVDNRALTAAHPNLAFGSWIGVRAVATGRLIRVRITDRGPARATGRCLDLSKGAAEQLGIIRAGVARVVITSP